MTDQTSLLEPTIAPSRDGKAVIIIGTNGARVRIEIENAPDATATIMNVAGKLARADCFRMENIDGGFQKVVG